MVLPGITSLWIVKGAHCLTFDEWMKYDNDYLQLATLELDLRIIIKTILIPIRILWEWSFGFMRISGAENEEK